MWKHSYFSCNEIDTIDKIMNTLYNTYEQVFICRGDDMSNFKCEIHEEHKDIVEQLKEEMILTQQAHDLAILFKMYSDPTRLKILDLLFKQELCVADITCILNMSQSAVSHQLSILRQNRIIKYRRDGKNIYYSLDDEHIKMIYDAGLSHIME